MPRLRRYCWRVGIAVELDDLEKCPECGTTGIMHRVLEDQDKCGCFAAITDANGGPCILPIGHDGPHVPHPDQVEYYRQLGKRIIIGDEDA